LKKSAFKKAIVSSANKTQVSNQENQSYRGLTGKTTHATRHKKLCFGSLTLTKRYVKRMKPNKQAVKQTDC